VGFLRARPIGRRAFSAPPPPGTYFVRRISFYFLSENDLPSPNVTRVSFEPTGQFLAHYPQVRTTRLARKTFDRNQSVLFPYVFENYRLELPNPIRNYNRPAYLRTFWFLRGVHCRNNESILKHRHYRTRVLLVPYKLYKTKKYFR